MKEGRGSARRMAAVAVAAIAAAAAAYLLFGGGADREDGGEPGVEPDRASSRERELKEKSRRLEQVLKASKARRAPAPKPLPEAEEEGDGEGPAPLSHGERAALKAALDGFYDPEELAGALAAKRAAEVSRTIGQEYGELYRAEEIEGPGGAVRVEEGVTAAIRRIGVVKDYALNLMHTQRAVGQEEKQREMMQSINDTFRERIDALNEDYPFLDVRLVSPDDI